VREDNRDRQRKFDGARRESVTNGQEDVPARPRRERAPRDEEDDESEFVAEFKSHTERKTLKGSDGGGERDPSSDNVRWTPACELAVFKPEV
jgi:hypothetical protein